MRVGILGGTGPLGRGLALRLAVAGAQVDLGSRDPYRAATLAEELRRRWPQRRLLIDGVGNAAAAEAEIIVAATPWEAAVPTAGELAAQLRGKVVISVANALVRHGREMVALLPPRASVAAGLQAELPESLVAAACHHLPAASLAHLDAPLEADVLVCSDHPRAREVTIGLVETVEGLRGLDAGSLAAAGPIEAFTAVLVSLNMRYKAHSTLRLAGIGDVMRAAPASGTGVERRSE